MTIPLMYKRFMLESNRIEGEDRLNPRDLEAVVFALTKLHTLRDITDLHEILGQYLNKPWVGKLRECNVMVGGQYCPQHTEIYALMERYAADLSVMSSWKAHNNFECIHPFQDLNGRVGRLIWLSKAVKEGYNFEIPFLQAYYYQTLRRTK